MDGTILATGAILVIAGCAGGFWYLRGRGAKSQSGSASSKRQKSGAQGSPEEQTAALDRMKAAIQDLLQGVSSTIGHLRGHASKYDTSLQQHRQSLEKMATIEDLRDLERQLLSEVKSVQSANEQYRHQLDDANRKVDEQQEELGRLQSAVVMDFLTEVPNRRALDDRMEEMMGRAHRYGNTFSIIVFDIDHFKAINDTQGHAAGDRILKAVAHLLDSHKRSSDYLARYGGEEFVLLLPETTVDNAERLANKTRERVAEAKFSFQKEKVHVTLSAGVGELNLGKDTAQSLFERVDIALYQAKNQGRNCVVVAETPVPSE